MTKAIEEAPQKLDQALSKANAFGGRVEEFQNELNETMDKAEARVSALVEKMRQAASGAEPDQEPTSRVKLAEHYETVTSIFYAVLRSWNQKHPDNPLVVTRGGGNRAELTKTLGDSAEFNDDQDINANLADYVKTTFSEHLGSRKRDPDPAILNRLDNLRLQIPEAALTFGDE